MVFHAEGLTRIKLHYTAQLTIRSVQGFENSDQPHFPAAESALPAVDKPITPLLTTTTSVFAEHVTSLMATTSLAGNSIVVQTHSLALLHMHKKHSCSITCVHPRGLHVTQLAASLPAQQLPLTCYSSEYVTLLSCSKPVSLLNKITQNSGGVGSRARIQFLGMRL